MPEFQFRVRARLDPQTLPRLIGLVAQTGLIPSHVDARQCGGLMAIMISQSGLEEAQAGVIANKMRSSVLVEDVTLAQRERILPPLDERRT